MHRLSVVLVLAGLWSVQAQNAECNKADVVFVLDESGSIWGPDFERQLKFVKDLSLELNLGKEASHIGVLTFSDYSRPRIGLTDYFIQEDFNRHVDRINQNRGGTNTYKAISYMRESYFGSSSARKDVPKVAIIITDGSSSDMDKTINEADRARADGITMFAIGVGQIGRNINFNELRGIANKPSQSYLFLVQDYNALDAIKSKLAIKTCEVTTLKPTEPPTTTPTTPPPQMIEGCKGSNQLDVVFSIPDEAGVMGTEASIEFIQTVSEETKISPELVQVGLCKQFCNQRKEVALRDSPSLADLKDNLDAARLKNTHLENILENIRVNSLKSESGSRQDSAKFVIVIVDNRLADPERTYEEAKKLHEMADVIVIGVSRHVNMKELAPIASGKYKVFHAKTYDDLYSDRRIRDAVVDSLCQGAKKNGYEELKEELRWLED